MRAVVQRVSFAKLSVNKKVISEINKGYLVLLGIKKGDTKETAEYLAKKVSSLRIMADENDKMNLNLVNAGGECLVVSQFTLNANTNDGNRTSFINAAKPELAHGLYLNFIEEMKSKNIKVKIGEFGAYMNIETELDGPATIIFDTDENTN